MSSGGGARRSGDRSVGDRFGQRIETPGGQISVHKRSEKRRPMVSTSDTPDRQDESWVQAQADETMKTKELANKIRNLLSELEGVQQMMTPAKGPERSRRVDASEEGPERPMSIEQSPRRAETSPGGPERPRTEPSAKGPERPRRRLDASQEGPERPRSIGQSISGSRAIQEVQGDTRNPERFRGSSVIQEAQSSQRGPERPRTSRASKEAQSGQRGLGRSRRMGALQKGPERPMGTDQGPCRTVEPRRAQRIVFERMNEQGGAWRPVACKDTSEQEVDSARPDVGGAVEELKNRIDQLEKLVEARRSPAKRPRMLTPFTERIMREPMGTEFKVPRLRYDGTGDPRQHVLAYWGEMQMRKESDAMVCRGFLFTLTDKALEWFLTLPAGQIDGFEDLADRFENHFIGQSQRRKHCSSLATVRQRTDESNRDFLVRWKEEVVEVEQLEEEAAMVLFLGAIRAGGLYKRLKLNPAPTYRAMMERAANFINIEEEMKEKEI